MRFLRSCRNASPLDVVDMAQVFLGGCGRAAPSFLVSKHEQMSVCSDLQRKHPADDVGELLEGAPQCWPAHTRYQVVRSALHYWGIRT